MGDQRIGTARAFWRAFGLLAVWALLVSSVEASIDAPGFGYEATTNVTL
jgi:hypothetical protein